MNTSDDIDDLRSRALRAAAQVVEISDRFPVGSARASLRAAAEKIKFIYVYPKDQKKRSILGYIRLGNRKIVDLVAELGLDRKEIKYLLDELIVDGFVYEESEMSNNERGGRPYRVFNLTEKGDEWIDDYLDEVFGEVNL